MSRNGYRGPKLPKFLLDKVQSGNEKARHTNISRKHRRKAERQQKQAQRHPSKVLRKTRPVREDPDSEDEGDAVKDDSAPPPKDLDVARTSKAGQPPKSILKKSERTSNPSPASKSAPQESGSEANVSPAPTISRRVQQRLDEDDAEIAALEKKLGIKGRSKGLEQDGLAGIADLTESDEDGATSLKRKRPEDVKWLRDKRRKATPLDQLERDVSDGSEDEEDIENPFSEDEADNDDFAGFDSDDNFERNNQASTPIRRRENPYVPPTASGATPSSKYIPPSLRAPASEDEEIIKQLRRQLQGLLNRLAESNMVSILQSLEELYTKNARQYVTSTLGDLLVSLVADPAVLNDSFLALHAGFAAGVYKIVGTDYGAQLLERIVEKLDHFHGSSEGKQELNLLAFLSNLYIFQVVGSAVVFDYVRVLLEELSENNTELLLRIIRNCGQALRQDDPSALKDIVLLLQRSVAKIGEANVSVRTKFMIETINDLKNNRMKAAGSSALAAEQTARMKKTLSTINKARSIRSTEPLQITLADIRDSEKKGKWWLVGASYHDPSKLANNSSSTTKEAETNQDDGYESETPGSVNLSKLAREHGMNTEVRRAIFIAILSSIDCYEAHMKLLKLHLKSKQMLEIPRVLVHCAASEDAYNPFYALVAMKFCGDHHKRKAFEFALWDFFRQMSGKDESEEEVTVRKIVNMAKFYGALIAEAGLSLRCLKKLEFTFLDRNSGMFVEVLLTMVFTHARKKNKADLAFDEAVKAVFLHTAGNLEVIGGLRHAIETNVVKADLAIGKKEKRAIERACPIALDALQEAAGKVMPVPEEDEDSM